jgi:hypothetical protein
MLMQSAAGIGRYFTCQSCARPLSVTSGWKAACAFVLVVAAMSGYFASQRTESGSPYLAIPIAVIVMSLLVRQRARVSISARTISWVSLLNVGMLGMALVAANYAVTM